ncbi:MAG: hypothetical protein WCS37_20245 [Chloroflexota bacterium]
MNGNYLTGWAIQGKVDAISVDGLNNVYLLSFATGRIQKFRQIK